MARPALAFAVAAFALAVSLLAPASAGAQAFGNAFEGMSNSKEPIQIEADRLEVLDSEGSALFEGNVVVNQGTTILKTSRLKVYYSRDAKTDKPGGNVRKIEATGKVAVRSGDQFASADSALVDMQAQTATLSGGVTVSQGSNVLSGCKLSINMATNAARLTPCGGRVSGVLTPSSNSN
ncbi:MAG: hypothetical protein KDJ80_00910 [Nitratireductor sp.]|nr:hypothetical protein [Nitratireductor sp.]